ncbi:MAG: TrkH family potassium uptake protein [Deltaproteobacteria bacterium]|nr:TrkH family potassium uptake protein [Deltaproteobacteria bacterium]MBW2658259.1 TrkH family potassium uptake protein [Deltaproteobacteria bacterium]
MKISVISNALGLVLLAFGVILVTPAMLALFDREYAAILPFITASFISIGMGFLLQWHGQFSRNFDTVKKTEGLLIVTLSWCLTGGVGAIPYLFFGLTPLDALFESVSGITTTGATILTDFSLYSKYFFFWRSLTQWLGGMGIIVLFVAILPQFAVAGRQMFLAEAPGPTEEKVTPRIAHTAKALWLVYLGLTLLEIIFLYLSGMDLFDAVCNSFSTMAAGGFSPNPLSIIGYNNPTATWIITLFMFLAGSNFALQYRSIAGRSVRIIFRNEEFRLYSSIILVASFALGIILLTSGAQITDALRNGIFQIVSIITTTGFSSADFALWSIGAQVVLFSMMLVGGCAGSAGGGVKVVRILVCYKYLRREITRVIHPNAVVQIKLDRNTISSDVQSQILVFFLFYLCLMTFSALLVTLIEGNPVVGLVGTAATIGNIGPGFGEIGPLGSFGYLSAPTKSIFILNMLVGRLELIPFLAMLHPDFWHFRK